MNPDQTGILVFRTNLASEDVVLAIRPVLDHHPAILHWNVDQHDVDKVLRVAACGIGATDVAQLVQAAGFICEELPD